MRADRGVHKPAAGGENTVRTEVSRAANEVYIPGMAAPGVVSSAADVVAWPARGKLGANMR